MNQRSSPAKGPLGHGAKRIKVNASQNDVSAGRTAGPIAACASERLRRREHLFRVTGHLHLAPDLGDAALTIDEKGRALDAEISAAVHALFLPHPVRSDRGALRVGGKRDLQIVLHLELVVARRAVRRNADDGRAGGGELRAQSVESDGFGGAAGSVVLGIEVDNHRLALEVLKMRLPSAIGGQLKVGRRIALGQFLRHIALVSRHYVVWPTPSISAISSFSLWRSIQVSAR